MYLEARFRKQLNGIGVHILQEEYSNLTSRIWLESAVLDHLVATLFILDDLWLAHQLLTSCVYNCCNFEGAKIGASYRG